MNETQIKAHLLMLSVVSALNDGEGETMDDRIKNAMDKLGLDREFVISVCSAAVGAGIGVEKDNLQSAEEAGVLDLDLIGKIAKVSRYYSASLAFVAGYKMANDEMAKDETS